MLVRMLARAAGPMGNWAPGREIDLPPEQAMALVNGHWAVLVSGNDGLYTSSVGGNEIETMMIAPAEPVLAPVVELRLKIGRYKGKTIAEIYAINPKYVADFLTKNVDPDISAAAKALVG